MPKPGPQDGQDGDAVLDLMSFGSCQGCVNGAGSQTQILAGFQKQQVGHLLDELAKARRRRTAITQLGQFVQQQRVSRHGYGRGCHRRFSNGCGS